MQQQLRTMQRAHFHKNRCWVRVLQQICLRIYSAFNAPSICFTLKCSRFLTVCYFVNFLFNSAQSAASTLPFTVLTIKFILEYAHADSQSMRPPRVLLQNCTKLCAMHVLSTSIIATFAFKSAQCKIHSRALM